MLPDAERFRLIGGPYRPPKCRIGETLRCSIRGEVRVVAMSDGPIPWPMTRSDRGGTASMILCGDLIKAVTRESAQAVGHWFGVKANTVWNWRKALGVDQNNAGTRKLRSKWWNEGGVGEASRPGRVAAFHSPERASKIADAKRGVPRPPDVVKKMRRAATGDRPNPHGPVPCEDERGSTRPRSLSARGGAAIHGRRRRAAWDNARS